MIVPETKPSLEDLICAEIIAQKAVDKNNYLIEEDRGRRIAQIALESFSKDLKDIKYFTKAETKLKLAILLTPKKQIIVLTGHEIARGVSKKALDAIHIDFSNEHSIITTRKLELRMKGETPHNYSVRKREFEKAESIIGKINSPNVIEKSLLQYEYTKSISKKKDYKARLITIVNHYGHDLDKVIKKKIVYSQSDLVKIAIDVAQGLVDIHSNGYIHRDIKPANILIAINLKAYIADLDFIIGRSELSNFKGTPLYTPPEIILAPPGKQTQEQSERGDNWAFGHLLYILFHPEHLDPPFLRNCPSMGMFRYALDCLPQIQDPLTLFYDWTASNEIEAKMQIIIWDLMIKDPNYRMSSSECLEALKSL